MTEDRSSSRRASSPTNRPAPFSKQALQNNRPKALGRVLGPARTAQTPCRPSDPPSQGRQVRKDQCHTRTFRPSPSQGQGQGGDEPKNPSLHDVSQQRTEDRCQRTDKSSAHASPSFQRAEVECRRSNRPRIQPRLNPNTPFDKHAPRSQNPPVIRPLSCHPSSVLCHLVEPDGIEPTTSCLQSRRSPS